VTPVLLIRGALDGSVSVRIVMLWQEKNEGSGENCDALARKK
jgi:hypothetical protein